MKELTVDVRNDIIEKVARKAESMVLSYKKGGKGYDLKLLKGLPEDYSSHKDFIMIVHPFHSSNSIEKRWETKRLERRKKDKNVQPKKKDYPSAYVNEHERLWLCGVNRG